MKKFTTKIITIFLLVFSVTSCQVGILSEQTMAQIIAEIHLLEGSMSMANVARSDHKKREAFYNSIFEKHKTNAKQFEKSMVWYSKRPIRLQAIFEESEKILKQIEEKIKAAEEAAKESQSVE